MCSFHGSAAKTYDTMPGFAFRRGDLVRIWDRFSLIDGSQPYPRYHELLNGKCAKVSFCEERCRLALALYKKEN